MGHSANEAKGMTEAELLTMRKQKGRGRKPVYQVKTDFCNCGAKLPS